jgi:hypothetical protein
MVIFLMEQATVGKKKYVIDWRRRGKREKESRLATGQDAFFG